jgi:CBS domain-containing protein
MKVREIMSSHVHQISSSAMLREAAERMRIFDTSVLPVVEYNKIVGTITDRDIIVRAISAGMDPRTTPVKDAMTPGATCCSEQDDADRAAAIMEDSHVDRLVVLSPDNKAVGMLSIGDLVVAGAGHLMYEAIDRICGPVASNRKRPRRPWRSGTRRMRRSTAHKREH